MKVHTNILTSLLTASILVAAPLALAPQDLPPGHPTLPPKPASPTLEPPQADPADVATVDAIVAAYYDSISGAAGEARDWDRFRSLFFPGGQFVTMREIHGQQLPAALTPDNFVQSNQRYFEGGGYFESEIHRRVDAFGSVAQVFSTYESRRASDQAAYSRGINSFQLLRIGDRWWIVSIIWDHERSENPIPAEYLPPSSQEDE